MATKEKIRLMLPRFMREWLLFLSNRRALTRWQQAGKPAPPPHIVKQHIVAAYAKKYGYKIFVETGTYRGDMVEAQKSSFDKLYTIELSQTLFTEATKRFRHKKHIELLLGDSAQLLPKLLPRLNAPALFWLDGHYSGDVTAMGEKVSPVLEELRSIFADERPHVILIDDARLFSGENGYPSMKELRNLVFKNRYSLTEQYDIIRLEPEN